MVNLVQTSFIFRRVVWVFASLSLLFLTFQITKPVIQKIIYAINPPKNLPTALYGKIDSPEFLVKKTLVNSNPQFTLNTKNGRLPNDLPKQIPVFRYKQPSFSFELGKKAQRTAAYLGYRDDSFKSQTTDEDYLWNDLAFNSSLRINIKTKELIKDTPMSGKSTYYLPGSITEKEALSLATTMLLSNERFNDGLYDIGTSKVYLGRFLGNEIRTINRPSEAQLARVDFFRTFVSFKIVTPDYYKGLLSVWVGKPTPATDNYKVLAFPKTELYYWPLIDKDVDKNATYPLIPVSLAWDEVQKGNGVISGIWPKDSNPFENYQPIRIDKILINDIFVAYYDSSKLQKYMQPVYVFEGIYNTTGAGAGQIAIYYPAISGDYILTQDSESK